MLWKRLWICRKFNVMMTITRQQAGKLRNSGSICGIVKGVLSTPKRPDRFYCPFSRLSWGTGRPFRCSKTAGTCSGRLFSSFIMNVIVPRTVRV